MPSGPSWSRASSRVSTSRRCSGCRVSRPASPSSVHRVAGRARLRLPAPAARPESQARLAVVYGSQTGNGKRIAERLGRAAEAAGLAVRVQSTRDYPLKDLAKERLLVVVMSTHGDGDPPDDARGFIEYLTGKRAPKLEQLPVLGARARRFELPEVLRDGPADRRAPGRTRRPAAAAARRLRPRLRAARRRPGSSRSWARRARRSARPPSPPSRACAPCRPRRSTRASSRLRRRCLPTSASRHAARPRTCVTSSCRSRARGSPTSRAMRSASGTRIRRWSWTRFSRRPGSMARSRSRSTVRRSRCVSGSRPAASSPG